MKKLTIVFTAALVLGACGGQGAKQGPPPTIAPEMKKKDLLKAAREALVAKNYDGALRTLDRQASLATDSDVKALREKIVAEELRTRPAREAAAIAARKAAGVVARKLYAEKLREHFLDESMDIKVSVGGKDMRTLRLQFSLFNDVWTHKFQQGTLVDEIYKTGFRRVEFSDGYHYNYHITWEK